MINDDKTGRSAWAKGGCRNTVSLWSQYYSLFFSLSQSHYFCFSAHVSCSEMGDKSATATHTHWYTHTHTQWTDGAAWSVWQITSLVVGLNPMPTDATNRPLWRDLKSLTQTVSYILSILSSCTYLTWDIYIPCFQFDLQKHQNTPSKQKRLNIKVLCINCHARDAF